MKKKIKQTMFGETQGEMEGMRRTSIG